MKVLTLKEIEQIEKRFSSQITTQAIVEIFQSYGVEIATATIRKYIQIGLLPKSVRIGEKGKYKGSKGLYPLTIIRKINYIRSLMAKNLTLEEIYKRYVQFQNDHEILTTSVETLFHRLTQAVENQGYERNLMNQKLKELKEIQRLMEKGMRQIQQFVATVRVETNIDDHEVPY